MAELNTYKALDLYTVGKSYDESSHRRGDRQEIWVKQLDFGKATPPVVTLTADSAAAVDDETISVTSDTEGMIYARDVLAFFTSDTFTGLAVVKEDTEVTTAAASIPVLPLSFELTSGDVAESYLMKPFLSVQSGGNIESSSTTFTNRNRHTGLTLARAKSEVAETASMSGGIVGSGRVVTKKPYADPGLAEIERVKRNDLRLYYQSRYAPYDDGGVGTGQEEGKCLVTTFTPSSDPGGFMALDVSIEVDGLMIPYRPLGMTDADLDTLNTPA